MDHVREDVYFPQIIARRFLRACEAPALVKSTLFAHSDGSKYLVAVCPCCFFLFTSFDQDLGDVDSVGCNS